MTLVNSDSALQSALHADYPGRVTTYLQIRNVSDDARRVLRQRAAEAGQSLNAYILTLIDREVSRPTVDEVLARAAARAETASVSAVDLIRAERDARSGDAVGDPPR